jgi:hypothetical protein
VRIVDDLKGLDLTVQAQRVASLAKLYNDAVIVTDATGCGAAMPELIRKAGAYPLPVVFNAKNKAEIITGLIVALENRRVAFPSHVELINEMKFYESKTTTTGHVRYGAPEGSRVHDDRVTALALSLWTDTCRVKGEPFAGLESLYSSESVSPRDALRQQYAHDDYAADDPYDDGDAWSANDGPPETYNGAVVLGADGLPRGGWSTYRRS